nr:immunoglobulin heavy chain junction region [Mus musculus]
CARGLRGASWFAYW